MTLEAEACALLSRGGLQADEEAVLSRAALAGDRRAAGTLVASVHFLVLREARRVADASGVDADDLAQEARVGVLRALPKFDPAVARFATYAMWWARASIFKASIGGISLVRVGTTAAQQRVVFGLSRATRALEARGEEVSDEALARYLKVSEGEVGETRRRMVDRGVVPLDLPDGDPWTPSGRRGALFNDRIADDVPAADDLLDERRRRAWLERGLRDVAGTLTLQEEDVLCDNLLAEEPRTLAEIATWHGVSRTRMTAVRRQVLQKLRRRLAPAAGGVA